MQVPTTFEFVDIAGLVRGASKGEGLGNQFLANIRETDAIVQVCVCVCVCVRVLLHDTRSRTAQRACMAHSVRICAPANACMTKHDNVSMYVCVCVCVCVPHYRLYVHSMTMT